MENATNERYSRQADIVPREWLLATIPTVIGVGAIGRQVAIQLTAIGVKEMTIWDDDIVDLSNVATQGYFYGDIGRPKVDVMAEYLRYINPDITIHARKERFILDSEPTLEIFVCIDSISGRKIIWEASKDSYVFYVDGRMAAESLRVLTNEIDSGSEEHYESTLFDSGEAYVGACTAKSTIYCANIAAGMMVSQFTKWLRDATFEKDIMLNIFGTELSCF